MMKQLTRFWDRTLLEGNVLDCVEDKGQIIVFAFHAVALVPWPDGEMIEKKIRSWENRDETHVLDHVMC